MRGGLARNNTRRISHAGRATAWTVAVCIATHKRPRGLERLVHKLEALTFVRSVEPALEIIVVDNDPERTAAVMCAELGRTSRWPILYVAEPRRGIPFARNAAVRAAQGRRAELTAFIDDDEVPEPAWLDELLAVMGEYQADVVTGPVLPLFEAEAPAWVQRGRFFERPRYKTGTPLDRAYTGNVVLRTAVFDEVGHTFDETLGLSGGSDTEFFLKAARAGCLIVWADTAIAHEVTPEIRTRAVWLLRRAYGIGNNWGTYRNDLQPSFRKAMRSLAKGLVLLPLSVVRGRHAIVYALQMIAIGIGYLAAKVGRRFIEYRETHGQ